MKSDRLIRDKIRRVRRVGISFVVQISKLQSTTSKCKSEYRGRKHYYRIGGEALVVRAAGGRRAPYIVPRSRAGRGTLLIVRV